MSMWVITANTSDFPGKHVVRRHEIGSGTEKATHDHHVGDTLDEVRAFVPDWAVRFDRDANDDPVIVEIWL
jgi:hypothetical protein